MWRVDLSIEKISVIFFPFKTRNSPKSSVYNFEAIIPIVSTMRALRSLIAIGSVSAAGGSTTALSRIKKGACVHSQWPIAISYHCPVAAMRARTTARKGTAGTQRKEGEGVDGRGQGGRDEEGADGTVFFAAKWQRARANRVGTSAATSQEESTREPPTSLFAKAKGPSSARHRQAVGRGSPGPSFLFRISLVPLSPSPPFIATSVSFLSSPRAAPARRACSKIFNFGRWHVPGRRISSSPSLLTPPSAILCRVSPDVTTRARQICKLEALFTDPIIKNVT